MKSIRYLVVALLPLLSMNTQAGDFDGSKLLICAPVTTMDCVRGDDCLTGLPEDVGAPAFMRLDFANRAVIGPKVTSQVLLMDKTADQILLQGREANFGWTIALNSENGEMAVTLANRNGVYVLFGSCTPL